jgi:hypothetical protein
MLTLKMQNAPACQMCCTHYLALKVINCSNTKHTTAEYQLVDCRSFALLRF